MQQRLVGSLRRATDTFGAFSTPQKLIAAIGIAVLVLGGFAFVRWASAPTLAPLFTNLAPSDASAIVDQLDSEGVAYQLTDGGQSVMVPREEVYRLRLKMSSAGLPASTDTGYALLDQQGVTASQFQQQVTYQRALEGELSKTIGSISGVKGAVVHLAIPAKDVFLDETKNPTASVLVETQPGKELPAQQVQSIVHLVASSVEGLSPDDVTVVDAKGQLLSAAGNGAGAAGGIRDQQTTEYEARVTTAVQQVLDRVVGPGNAVATVTADLDFDATERTSETFSANQNVPPLSSTTTTEQYTGNGTPAGGVLGPDNIQVPSGAGGGQGSSYKKESNTSNNAVNKVTEHTTASPGGIRRQSVAVVVDAGAAGTVNMADLTATVTAAAGMDSQRGDSLSVTRMPFNTDAAQAASTALKEAQAAEKQAQLLQLVRTGGIALAVLALAAVAFLVSRRRRTQERENVDIGELQVLQPEDDDDLLELESAGDRELEEVGRPALPPAPKRETDLVTIRGEVAELVERQPDEVAELLRGWLADRRS
ncbi:MAG: flagellar basal-body MS-ring/collar protein FliF [Actinomycetes bacterium]